MRWRKTTFKPSQTTSNYFRTNLKRHLIAAVLLLALAGLTFVQFRLLVIGAKLEKQRFDQRAVVVQRNIRQALNEPNALSDGLVTRLKRRETGLQQPDFLLDSLNFFLQSEMQKVGISPNFSFAITPRFTEEVLLSSKNYRAEKFTFNEYPVPLGDYFASRLYGSFTLHIDVENLFGYLLGELDYLVVPSVLCLLAILACLGLLLHILRREERLNAIKNDFINNLTHELKTPAFGISLAGKLARDSLAKGDAEKTLEFLQVIENEKNKLVSHAEKVLELASLESSQQHFRKEKTDLHGLVAEVVENFRPGVELRNGSLTVNLEASVHEVEVDRGHFKNALFNLLDNALKYSPEPPIIEVATANVGQYFQVAVSDQGIGISHDDQRKIFEKFYRANKGDLHEVKGFGLGLSHVQQVVKAHKGKVEVESEAGKGAVFRILIPCR